MDEHEIGRRARALPAVFADRLPDSTLTGLRLMDEGGEYGELVLELAATLAKVGATVSTAEQQEIRVLLASMDMPTRPADQLTVLP